MTEIEALQKACDTVGGQSALARLVGRKQQFIWACLKRTGRCSAEIVLDVERVSGVPRSELRPDLYPPEQYPPDRGDQALARASE